jgi:hypothetical protein
VLIRDDFDFIIVVVSDTLQDILQNNESKQEYMYDKIETELRGVQQSLHSSHTVSTAPPPSEKPKLGDEPTQIHIIYDATKDCLRHAQEEKEWATVALKQAQEAVIEKHSIAQQEKAALQSKFEEEKAQI